MATLLQTRDFSAAALSAITGPTITNVQVTDSSYNVLSTTALSTTTGGYLKITGTNFTVSTNIYLDYGTLIAATSVTFISSTQLNVQMPAMAAGSYIMILVTNNGSVAIRINAVTYAVTPVWTSNPGITGYNGVKLSVNLTSTIGFGDSISYSVASGSSLPLGLSLSSTGLLSGIISGLSNTTTYNFTLVATDSELQATNQTFTVVISTQIDLNFNQTMLLDGALLVSAYTIDSSTNNYQVTPYGLARGDYFSPYYGNGYYSLQLNGTTDYIYGITNSSAYTEGQGSYTLEGFFNLNQQGGGTLGTTQGILNTCASTSASSAYHAWGFYSANQIAIGTNNGLTYNYVTLSRSIPLYTWFHLAIVFNATTNIGTIYYNGTQVGSWSDVTTYTAVNTGIWMVGSMYGSTGLFKGYISSLRFVKSIAVYTSNFTISTSTPLPVYPNFTALMLCQNSTFSDNSINASTNTVVPAGAVKISVYIPYTSSTLYSTYGSGYLNGVSDYWGITNATNLQMAGSDFTIEANLYFTALPTTGNYFVICSKGAASTSNFEYQFSIFNNSGSYKLDLQVSINGTSILEYQSNNVTLYINQWYNVSVSKLLSTAYFWINGATAGQFSTVGSSLFTGSANLIIGALVGSTTTYYFSGYVSNFRLTKGTGIYYLPYTAPTTPITISTNTQLLTFQFNGAITNNGFIDTGPFNNIITRNGYATQGAFTPFSQNGWSIYLDGASGYVTTPGTYSGTSNFNLSTGVFTVEAWIYTPALNTQQSILNLCTSLTSSSGLTFGITSTGYPYIGNGSTTTNGNVAVNANAWNHIAAVSNGTTCILYTNGVANGAGFSFNPNSASFVYIGRDAAGVNYFNGYISNIRIIKGSAAYTGAFSPSTTPLIITGNTVLLTGLTNRLLDASLTNLPLTSSIGASGQAFSPFIDNINIPVTYSGYFPGGTSTYITTANTQIIPASVPYTIDCWVNISTYTGNPVIVSQGTTGNAGRTSFFISSSGYVSFGIGGSVVNSLGTVPLNTWTYIAVVVSGVTATFYINNSTSGSSGISGTPQASVLVVGGDWQGSPSITGYISNLRISNIARNIYYAPLTYFTSDIACTLLMFVDNSGIYDLSPLSNAVTITGTANTGLTVVNPYNNTLTQPISYSYTLNGGSIYLNGVTDYLTIPASINNAFGTNNFTIEFWLYPNNLPGTGTTYSLVDFWYAVNGSYLYGATTQWTTVVNSSGALQFIYATGLSSIVTITSAKTINSGVWSHVAFVRNNNVLTMYINGVPDTVTGSLTGINIGYSNYVASIGVETNTKISSSFYNGYMSNIRINSYALYTTPFSPPTAPFVSTTAGTLLLLNGTHTGVFDTSGRTNFITYNTQSTPTIYKFGTISLFFNGTNSYLLAPYNPFYYFGTGNFTIDFWIYPSSVASGQQVVGQYNSAYSNWSISFGATGTLNYYISSTGNNWNIANGLTMGIVTTGAWYHIALVRNGTTFTPYVNGVAGTTATSNLGIFPSTAPLTLGANYNSGSSSFDGQLISTFSNYFSGYIDDFRITKGIARFTTSFTPPTLGAYFQ